MSQIEFGRVATLHVRRAKNGKPSAHPLRGDEVRALRELRWQSSSLRPGAAVCCTHMIGNDLCRDRESKRAGPLARRSPAKPASPVSPSRLDELQELFYWRVLDGDASCGALITKIIERRCVMLGLSTPQRSYRSSAAAKETSTDRVEACSPKNDPTLIDCRRMAEGLPRPLVLISARFEAPLSGG
jgi:hypothetical protein